MDDVTALAAMDCAAVVVAPDRAEPATARRNGKSHSENSVEIVSPCQESVCAPASDRNAFNNLGDEAISEVADPDASIGVACHSEDDGTEVVADASSDAAARIEALLFASDAPLSANKLAELVEEATAGQVRAHIEALNVKYEQAGLTFRIEAIARGYQMMSLPEYRPWIARMHTQRDDTRLTPAALEALSIIAYKQPVIRADIDAIRGVNSGEVISRLRELGLVRVVGRAEIVGRPLLYGTTRKFLDTFGLGDLHDLPPMEALSIKEARSKPHAEVEPVAPPIAAAGA